MAKVPIPFAEWRPDLALLDNEFASIAENVFFNANSYLPFPGHSVQTITPLPGPARGLYAVRTTLGAWKIYGGTSTRLYMFSAGAWSDVTRATGGNYAVADGDLWRFQVNGVNLYAVHNNDDMQVINIDSGTNFALAPGSPPRARHVAQVGPHLILSGLSANKRKLQWSATENPTGWTIGTGLSDEQEMPEGGEIMGVAGGELGYIVQERAIRTLQYLPGDTTYIFSISRVVQDRGCVSRYGFTAISGVLFFPAEDGIFALAGQQLLPIGEGKVNDWFMSHSDPGRRHLILAFDFQHAHRIGFAFYSSVNSTLYDMMLIYDWALQRFSYAVISAQIWAALSTIGLDLDRTGDEPGDALLDSTASSLDSPAYFGGRPVVGGIDANGILSFLSGPNLSATLETAERHLVPGMRAFVSEVYPLDDTNPLGTVSIGWRERLQDAWTWDLPVGIEITGTAAAYNSARLHRFRRTIPVGATWKHAQGVLVEAQQDGTVA